VRIFSFGFSDVRILGPFDYKAVPIPHLTYAARANASSFAFIEFVAFKVAPAPILHMLSVVCRIYE
jgi:hypothetical protein